MKYFYGPVLSKRLGFSLGVDITPKKACSFNCLYCQQGKTTIKTMHRLAFVNLNDLREELKNILKKRPKINYITLSGSGEPTLHKNLDKIVTLIKKTTRNKYPLCLITNSSLLYQPKVRKEIRELDLIIPSLDAATPSKFKKINRPHLSIGINKVIRGLVSLRREFKGKIWLEIMLIKGLNDSFREAKKFKDIIEKTRPDKVQINTPSRPSLSHVKIPSYATLKKFQRALGPIAEIVASPQRKHQKKAFRNIKFRILMFLKRRPATLNDLVSSLGYRAPEILKELAKLLKDKKIKGKFYGQKRFFTIN